MISADDLPLLGTEPLALELANTDYGQGGPWPFDFLAEEADARLWLQATGLLPADHEVERLSDIIELRDRARRLIVAALEGRPPRTEDLEHINRCAGLVSGAPALRFDPEAGWHAAEANRGSTIDRALQRLAQGAITLLAGDDRERLRVCAAPDCTMLFVQAHHRRRFCHPSCSNRTRQARFAARHPQQT